MCLIAFAWNYHPEYRLILVANRDEFYARPTQNAHFWPEHPQLLAGRDLSAGGTWLGLTRQGRLAALTNYRDPAQFGRVARSRGELPLNYLVGTATPQTYLAQVHPQADEYNGFNLLVGDRDGLYYYSNYEHRIRQLPSGVYGLSNHLLDTPWHKVSEAKARLAAALAGGPPDPVVLGALLLDAHVPPDTQVQRTGLPLERERVLAPIFIASPDYGTCSTSVLLISRRGEVFFQEKVYNPLRPADWQTFEFSLTSASLP
jgi:uncharacterized protein with NRDE domain